MKKILIPTDFSPYSVNAAKYAMHLAAANQFQVILFNCYHIPAIDPMMPGEFISDLSESMKNDSLYKLNELKNELENYCVQHQLKANIDLYSRIGFAVEEIVSLSEELEPELVVLGSRHRSGFQKFLSGSILKPLIDDLTFPLMIIPENFEFTPKPLKILYATDFKEADSESISRLYNIFRAFNPSIECVHFDVDNTEYISEYEMAQIEHHFKEKAAAETIHFKILKTHNIKEQLQQYIVDNQIDIVSTFSKKRNFLQKLVERSFSKMLADESRLPLVIFK